MRCSLPSSTLTYSEAGGGMGGGGEQGGRIVKQEAGLEEGNEAGLEEGNEAG